MVISSSIMVHTMVIVRDTEHVILINAATSASLTFTNAPLACHSEHVGDVNNVITGRVATLPAMPYIYMVRMI